MTCKMEQAHHKLVFDNPDSTKVEVLQMALLICLGKLYGRGCGWLYLEALKLRREAMHMVLNKVME